MLDSVQAGAFYLDAGTGSMLVQLAVAGVAGAAVFAKLAWSRVSSPFRRKQASDVMDSDVPQAHRAHQAQQSPHDD